MAVKSFKFLEHLLEKDASLPSQLLTTERLEGKRMHCRFDFA
jgi:hypothetical protein